MVNNKGVVAAIVIIIVVVVGGVYLAAQSTGPNNNTVNTSNITPQNVSKNNTTTVNNETNATNSTNITGFNNSTTISAQQAQKIAQAYILESGAKAGNPTLTKWPDERLVWHVPIINSNGTYEGIGIDIDAQTGANLGES
jgi:hypothetical protein